jgi:hypothetical protein
MDYAGDGWILGNIRKRRMLEGNQASTEELCLRLRSAGGDFKLKIPTEVLALMFKILPKSHPDFWCLLFSTKQIRKQCALISLS